jgi:ABC-type lipoprotein export system ATPase subunit
MQADVKPYIVNLESPIAKSFRCVKAANSLDIDPEAKSKHHLKVNADLDTDYNVGLIVGASGSGKTTLAKKIFGDDCFKTLLKEDTPIIDQLPEHLDYDQCAQLLAGVGLTSVPCWIRPAYTLSNGQKARAEACLQMANTEGTIIIDEWTSVVDRTVGKVMSSSIQKHARRTKKKIVLASCHYDVIDWLNPDWIIDCNKQEYIERRSMVGTFKRTDRLRLDIRAVGRKTWPYFSKYHYLSERLPTGKIFTYGLFLGAEQIGFACYAPYIIGNQDTYFSNRVVIHPDYAGLGLSVHMINESAKDMVRKGYNVKGKFSNVAIYKIISRDPNWRMTKIAKPIRKGKSGYASTKKARKNTIRTKTVTYHVDFVWKPDGKT